MTIQDFYRPSRFGAWLGANGPAVPTDPNFNESIDFLAHLGLNWIRLNTAMEWLWRADYFDTYRKACKYVVDAGLTPLPVISGAPDDYRGNTYPTDAGLDHLDEMLVAPFERLWQTGVRAIEVQNEWDGPGVAGKVDVPRQVQVQRLLYDAWHTTAARHRSSDALVLVGGTSPAAMSVTPQQAPNTGMTGSTFKLFPDLAYKSFLSLRGAWGSFDYGAHHSGSFSYDPHTTANRNQQWNGFYATERIAKMIQHVRPGVRVFVTEAPWPSDQMGGEQPAADRAYQDLMHFLTMIGNGYCGPVIVYHGCRDNSPGHDNSHAVGIRRADGTPKKVCDVLRAFAAVAFARSPIVA